MFCYAYLIVQLDGISKCLKMNQEFFGIRINTQIIIILTLIIENIIIIVTIESKKKRYIKIITCFPLTFVCYSIQLFLLSVVTSLIFSLSM